MSSPAPQLPRDDARALCAPANNLNTGFLQFDTAHEGDLVCTSVALCIYCNHSSVLLCSGSPHSSPSTPHHLFSRFPAAYAHLRAISRHESSEFVVRNFVCVIHKMQPEQALVETEVSTFAAAVAPAVLHRLVQSASHTTALAHKTSLHVCVCWVLI